MSVKGRSSGEIRQLQQKFDALDSNGDGLISLLEFRDWIDETNLSTREKSVILKKTVGPQDRPINFNQFQRLASSGDADVIWTKKVLFRIADVVISRDQRSHVYDYLHSYSCLPPPLFMLSITIAEIAVFLYFTLKAGAMPGWFKGCGGCYDGNGRIGPLPFYPYKRAEAWRFVSYLLVHAGIEHLLGNCVIQILLGVPLELVHRMWRIAPLYLIGVITGSLLQYTLDGSVILVGASGGVYALLTAHLSNNWSEMPYGWVRLVVVFLFVGFDVGHVIYRRVFLGACDRISYAAHIGGATAGFLLGLIVLRNLDATKWERILSWVALGLFGLVFVALVVLTVVFEPTHAPAWSLTCAVRNSTG